MDRESSEGQRSAPVRARANRAYPRLKPGPKRSPARAASQQRARLYAALIETVAEGGYGALTVRDLTRRAGVSSRTFYEHFASKEECFLATYDLLALRLAKRVGDAQRGCRDWRERLQLAFDAWADEIAREPGAAQLALVSALAAGPAAHDRMRRVDEMFEVMIARSFARAPDRIIVPRLVVAGIVSGVGRVARARVLANRTGELPRLAPELLDWALCFRCQTARALARLGDPYAPALGELRGAAPKHEPLWGDDRTRVVEAAAQLAVEQGYAKLTAWRIRRIAGVSRQRFDALFPAMDECFIAALEQRTRRALARAVSAGTASRTWAGALHRALWALCTRIATDPARARLQFIEAQSLSGDGIRWSARTIARIARELRASAPPDTRPSALAVEASVGAVWGIIHREVVDDNAHLLAEIAPTLSYLALAPAIGGPQAVEAIASEHARVRRQRRCRGA